MLHYSIDMHLHFGQLFQLFKSLLYLLLTSILLDQEFHIYLFLFHIFYLRQYYANVQYLTKIDKRVYTHTHTQSDCMLWIFVCIPNYPCTPTVQAYIQITGCLCPTFLGTPHFIFQNNSPTHKNLLERVIHATVVVCQNTRQCLFTLKINLGFIFTQHWFTDKIING